MAGTVYTVAPIPPDPAHTSYVDAGVLEFGIEYRLLDDAELAANYAGADLDEIQDALQGQTVEDDGVSIHVVAKATGHEYLRFDCFRNGPHYHYIEPSGERQTIVEYDAVALGDMLRWTIVQLRTRLVAMLEHAGGVDVAATLDHALIEAGLAELERRAEKARAELDAHRAG